MKTRVNPDGIMNLPLPSTQEECTALIRRTVESYGADGMTFFEVNDLGGRVEVCAWRQRPADYGKATVRQ